MKIAVVTDSNSGIFDKQAKQLGVYTLPMPFCIDGARLYEGVDLSAAEFYEKQAAGPRSPPASPARRMRPGCGGAAENPRPDRAYPP